FVPKCLQPVPCLLYMPTFLRPPYQAFLLVDTWRCNFMLPIQAWSAVSESSRVDRITVLTAVYGGRHITACTLIPSTPFPRSTISSLERINSLPRARLIILPIWLARRSGCFRARRTQSSPNP